MFPEKINNKNKEKTIKNESMLPIKLKYLFWEKIADKKETNKKYIKIFFLIKNSFVLKLSINCKIKINNTKITKNSFILKNNKAIGEIKPKIKKIYFDKSFMFNIKLLYYFLRNKKRD